MTGDEGDMLMAKAAALALLVFVAALALSGCAGHGKELAECRMVIPKCDYVITEQEAELKFDKVQIGLCNDLNEALMLSNKILNGSVKVKPAKARKYLGTSHREKA